MTDTTFSLKQNAKRAASRMIAKGSAPSLAFEIVPQGELFAIQWGAPIAKAPVIDDAGVRDDPEAVCRAGSAERLAASEPGSVTPPVQYQRKADAKAAADAMLKSGVAPGRKYTVAGETGHFRPSSVIAKPPPPICHQRAYSRD
jgi:hypothetical protein